MVVRNCTVPFCNSRRSEEAKIAGISFHEYPSNLEVRESWIKAISRKDPDSNGYWTPKCRDIVCSLHFTAECFRTTPKRRTLDPKSIPTLFPGYPLYMKTGNDCVKRRRIVRVPEQIPSCPENIPSSDSTEIDVTCNTIGENLLMLQDQAVNRSPYKIPTITMKCANSKRKSITFSTNAALRCKALKIKNDTANRKIRRLNSKIEKLEEENKKLQDSNKSLSDRLSTYNINLLEESVINEDTKALFLKDQLFSLDKKRMNWSDCTIRYTVLLHQKSPASYRFLRKMNILSLPSRSTLKRYVGNCNEVISNLIKERLSQESARVKDKEIFESLSIDEMKIKPSARVISADTVLGKVRMNGLEEETGEKMGSGEEKYCGKRV